MPSFKTLSRKGVSVSAGERVSLGTMTLEVGGDGDRRTSRPRRRCCRRRAASGRLSSRRRRSRICRSRTANFASLAALSPGVNGTARARWRRSDELRHGRHLGRRHRQQQPDAAAERGCDRRSEGAHLQLPGRIRPIERPADHGGDQERHEPVPRIGATTSSATRTGTANSWANKQNGDAEDPSRSRTTGATRSAVRSASRAARTSSSSSSPPSTGRALGRRHHHRFRVPTDLERQGDFSQTRDNTGNPLPVHHATTGSASAACTATATATCFATAACSAAFPRRICTRLAWRS